MSLALAVALGAGAPAHADEHIVVEDFYVPVATEDRLATTTLRMQVARPAGNERVPTLLGYSGYGHRVDLRELAPNLRLLRRGYAIAQVSLRGSGCSGGIYDFLSPQEARDGRDVVEWLAEEAAWSNGRVAMFGESYTGFSQLPVAALRPKGLVAIAPGTALGDLYRDVAHPGGISNTLTPAAFSAVVLEGDARLLHAATAEGDEQCVRNQAERALKPAGTAAAFASTHRWDDAAMRGRAPGARIRDIEVPMFTVTAWQDQTLGSRPLDTLAQTGGPFHAVLSNGGHGFAPGPANGVWYSQRVQERLADFLDFYVKGIDDGFSDRPPVEVWWEAQRGPDGDVVPRWTTGAPRLPTASARSHEFFLSSRGRLTPAPGEGAPDVYTYVGGSGQYRGDPALQSSVDWSGPAPDGQRLRYTTPPLEKDLAALGSGSLDLWLSSTAPDTDLQAVLTEVRPDGQEVYVQPGYLRASHRRLDPARSTATRPFHTHQQLHTEPLIPLAVTPMRLEIPTFGHVFRKGSSVRIWIDAPPRTSGMWGFDSLPGPSLNRVHHDAQHPSVLRLSVLPGHAAPVGLPECGTLLRQPCRPAG